MVDPLTMAAVAGPLFGNMFGGGGPTGPVPYYDANMLGAAIRQQEDFAKRFSAATGARATGPSGTSITGTREISGKEQKSDAFIDYLTTEKGLSQEEAQKRANKITANPNKSFRQNKGFKRWVKQGNVDGLSIGRDGRIKAAPKAIGPSIEASPQQQQMQDMMRGFNMQSMMAAQGLPFIYGQQERRAGAVRDFMTPGLMNQAMNFSMGGLSRPEQEGLQAIRDYMQEDFKGYFDDLVGQAQGKLFNTGFTQSSLVDDIVTDMAIDPARDYSIQSAARMAELENQFRTAAVGRDAQRLQSGLGAFGTLGQMQGIGSVMGGLVNPAMTGGLTDAQSLSLLQQVRGGDLQNMLTNQGMMSNLLQQPLQIMPDGGGTLDTLLNLGGAGAILGGMGALGGGRKGSNAQVRSV